MRRPFMATSAVADDRILKDLMISLPSALFEGPLVVGSGAH
jgi:hypothetical protein